MGFDPFGDFETAGYLRNHFGRKDPEAVKLIEHASFAKNAKNALQNLEAQKTITVQDVRETHRILFQDVYPWAGQDRSQNARKISISKVSGNQRIKFGHPKEVPHTLQNTLNTASKANFRDNVGKFIGELAYNHPFLDGNGRAITTVTDALARKADFHIRWEDTTKFRYLEALTNEINEPNKGHLDKYLKPHIRDGARSIDDIAKTLTNLRGLSKPEQEHRPSKNPTLILVEGTDAASKSAIIAAAKLPTDARNIGPRTVQEERNFTGPNAARTAVEEAVQRHHDAIEQGKSFIVEKTLTSGYGEALVDQAKKAGFKVELHVGGPHNIAETHPKLTERLAKTISAVDKTVLYDQDNSNQTRKVATLSKEAFEFDKKPPNWAAKAAIQSASIDAAQAQTKELAQHAQKRALAAAQAGGLNTEQVQQIQRQVEQNLQQQRQAQQSRDTGLSR